MRFSITWEHTAEVGRKSPFFSPLELYLNSFFYAKSYGDGVISLYIGLNCNGPIQGSKSPAPVFSTGYLLRKRYTKASRRMEVNVKLNYKDVMEVDSQSSACQVLASAFQSVVNEIKGMKVKDFDLKAFENDLFGNLNNGSWINNPLPSVQWPHNWEELALQRIKQTVPKKAIPSMAEDKFWKLIVQAGDATTYFSEKQCEILIELLITQPVKQIIGFELQLRKQLKRLYRYDVLAVAKIVEGYVSDDSFTYFCCNLILLGPEVCNQIIEYPDNLIISLYPSGSGELLLSVADAAFEKANSDFDEMMPREYGNAIYNYDLPDIQMSGKDWKVDDLRHLFPALTTRYSFNG